MADESVGTAPDALEAAINKAIALTGVEIGGDDAEDDDAPDAVPAVEAPSGSDGDTEASGDDEETEEEAKAKPDEVKPEAEPDDATKLKNLQKAKRLLKTDPLAAAKLAFGEEGVKALKLDSKKWAEFRRTSQSAERKQAARATEIQEAESRVRAYADQVGNMFKAQEAYDAGDFDLALKLAFPGKLEGANDFYKAHRAKIEGRDPRVTKQEKEIRELRERLEAKERAELEAKHSEAQRAQITEYVAGLASVMAESDHEGVAAASRVKAFQRDVYSELQSLFAAGKITRDDVEDVLPEVSAKVFEDGGWSEVLSGEQPSAHPGAKPVKRGRLPRSINPNRAIEVPAPGTSGKRDLDSLVDKYAPRVQEELRRSSG